MNDEKYMYFTERIQNTLLRSEVLCLMKDANSGDEEKKSEFKRQQDEKKEREAQMSRAELLKVRQIEHEERKKARVEKLHTQQVQLDAPEPNDEEF